MVLLCEKTNPNALGPLHLRLDLAPTEELPSGPNRRQKFGRPQRRSHGSRESGARRATAIECARAAVWLGKNHVILAHGKRQARAQRRLACAQGCGDAQSNRKSCKRTPAVSPRREPRRHQERATRGVGPARARILGQVARATVRKHWFLRYIQPTAQQCFLVDDAYVKACACALPLVVVGWTYELASGAPLSGAPV